MDLSLKTKKLKYFFETLCKLLSTTFPAEVVDVKFAGMSVRARAQQAFTCKSQPRCTWLQEYFFFI